jgi:DNA transformation protein
MEIDELKGLGDKSTDMLKSIGISTVNEFMAKDPFVIYASLKKQDPSISLNMLYAIIGAQENLHWQEVATTRKTEILMRLDDMGLAPGK